MRASVVALAVVAVVGLVAGTAQADPPSCRPGCLAPVLPIHGATGPADASLGAAPLAGVIAALGALGAGLALVEADRELRERPAG